MHAKNHKPKQGILLAGALLLVLLASACGPGKPEPTPTMSVDAVFTAAYTTLIAQQATQLALTPPTDTPTPTTAATLPPPPSPFATLAFASPTTGLGTGGSTCDSSAFVSDVTIPDNTIIDSGKKFTKTWRLLNNGTCTWDTSYSIQFDSGDQMGGGTTAVPSSVSPGSTVDISVALTAPTTNGTYKGVWRMHNASGVAFGDTPWVIIKVGTGGTATAGPSPTSGPSPTPTITTTPHSGMLLTISANVPDFKITFTDATTTPDCAWSADHRSCSLSIKSGWSGTITPSKGDYVFTPESKSFTNLTKDTSFTFSAE